MLRYAWLLLVVLASTYGAESADTILERLSQQCFPDRGVAAVPRLGTWSPDGDGEWQMVEEQRRVRLDWPSNEALQGRLDLVEGALRGSSIHTVDEWLGLLPATRDRLDLARLLIADGRWRNAVTVLNCFSQAQIVANERHLSLWREAWAALLDMQSEASRPSLTVLDPAQVDMPPWDDGFAQWYADRVALAVDDSLGQWSCLDEAEITHGADVQITQENAYFLVAPLRPGHLRWTWREIDHEAKAFDPRWLAAPVIAQGDSCDSAAQVVPIPTTTASNLVLIAELEDGVAIAWTVVHPLPIQLYAWSDGVMLSVLAADIYRDAVIPCPPVTIMSSGSLVRGGHQDGMMWVQPLTDLPTGAPLEISAGESTCRLDRPQTLEAPWRLATWWSRAFVVPREIISLAGCVRRGEWTKTQSFANRGGRYAMRLQAKEDSTDTLDLGEVDIDDQGCFVLTFDVPQWFTTCPILTIGNQHFTISAPPKQPSDDLELAIDDELPSGRYSPPMVRWQSDAQSTWYPWRDDYDFIPGANKPISAALTGSPCFMMRSNGADMAGEPLPSVLEMLPAAPEGLWQWKWAGFKAGRWYSGGAMSWVRSSQTVLNCDVAATAERVTIRITDQDQRPVTGARVMLRVTEDSNSNAIADTEAFSALFTGAKPYSVSASSVILARCYSGMAWKMLRWSACVYRNPPAIGDFSLQIKNNLRRRGLRRCCGGCGFGRESQLMAVDPLALWRPWVVTSDDGVISERFVWPTPFPDAMKITVIAISGDRIGQACGTLRGDWTPPN